MIFSLLSYTCIATSAKPSLDEPKNTTMSTSLSESTTNSSKFVSYNSTSSDKPIPPEYTLELKEPPKFLPDIITNPNGSQTMESSPDWDDHWWKITYWGYPTEMLGSFTAVANTINPLYSGDKVLYLPLNVAYGTSTTNFVWYQFDVRFEADGNVQLLIWEGRYPLNPPDDYIYHSIGLPYTVGHTYSFSLSTAEPDTITFYINDDNTGEPWAISSDPDIGDDTWDWPIAGLDMISMQTAFSPASCVEGYTTDGTLNDIPYLETVTGWGITTHWYAESGPQPIGIRTVVLPYSSYYLRWAMLKTTSYYVEAIYDSGPYGSGSVSSPTNLIGQLPNNQYANIYGGNPGDGGYIVGRMDAPAATTIKIRGYSEQYYQSDLYVYVAADENFIWTKVAQIRITSSSPQWYSVATVHTGFRYIAVSGYDTGFSVYLHLDTINVDV